MALECKIGFLGAGKMATALARGIVRAGLVPAESVLASDPAEAARRHFTEQTGAATTSDNTEVARFGSVLFVAVKPGQVQGLLGSIAPQLTPGHLVISIAAGVTLARLEAALPGGARVVRVMPNTPALVGAGASAFALGHSVAAQDAELALKLLGAVGLAVQVPESLLDAVTGLSGSGPAFVFMMIEALSDGGVAAGLPRDTATRLAAQTVLGSAKLLLETGLHPGALKDMVTSPGGTTIEGVHELESAGMRNAFISAVRAAAEKSKKLGQA